MLLDYIVLAVALLLSGVAAYYSIVGLAAIFSGAFFSIVLMGSALELGKLVSASWLYQNWDEAPKLMKYYLSTAIIVLMFITSMGIFGYLSKAHLETAALATSDTTAEIQTLVDTIESRNNSKILVEKQLAGIDNILVKYIELGSVTKGIQEKKKQTQERRELEIERKGIDKETIELKSKLNTLRARQAKIEVEVGPLKYIAELMYGRDGAKDHLDSSVRMVIILLIIVFDPLAVILLIAANFNLKKIKRREQLKKLGRRGIILDKNSIMEM